VYEPPPKGRSEERRAGGALPSQKRGKGTVLISEKRRPTICLSKKENDSLFPRRKKRGNGSHSGGKGNIIVQEKKT